MADPATIIGLVAGLLSLGIQVHDNLLTYIRTIKDREDDIASVSSQAATLKGILEIIQTSSQNGPVGNQALSDMVTSSLQSSLRELTLLQNELASINTSQQSSASSTVKGKIKETAAVLSFPRARLKLAKLEERIRSANATLQTALQALGLEKLDAINASVSNPGIATEVHDIATEVHDITAEIHGIATEAHSIAAEVHGISTSTTAALASLDNLHQSIQPLHGELSLVVPAVEHQTLQLSQQLHTEIGSLDQTVHQVGNELKSMSHSQLAILERMITTQQSQHERFDQLERLISSMPLDRASSSASAQLQPHKIPYSPHNLATLASKPDTLRELCDELSVPKSSLDFESERPLCNCRPRQAFSRHFRHIGPLWIFFEHKSKSPHFDDCEYAQINTTETTKVVGIATGSLARLVRGALAISFQLNYGAGGASINPYIGYRPLVDGDTAPVFKLVSLVSCCLLINHKTVTVDDLERLYNSARAGIRKLYQDGKAGPRDQDAQSGETVLHGLAGWFYHLPDETFIVLDPISKDQVWRTHETGYRRVLADLIGYGVPLDAVDNRGRTKADCMFEHFRSPGFQGESRLNRRIQSFLELLPACASSEQRQLSVPEYMPGIVRYADPKFHPSVLLAFPSLFELVDLSPMAVAALRNDDEEVRRLALRDPTAVLRFNIWNLTPLHYATEWPELLRTMMGFVPSLPDSDPELSRSVFRYAAVWADRTCSEKHNSVVCNDSGYCESAEILLENFWAPIRYSPKLPESSSHRLKKAIVLNLKECRSTLQSTLEDLGLLPLPSPRTGIEEDVFIPDDSIASVVTTLERDRGISLLSHPDLMRKPAMSSLYLYHELQDCEWAELLWEHGFRDVNSCHIDSKYRQYSSSGDPPLARRSTTRRPLVVEAWLLDHGADLLQPSKRERGEALGHLAVHGLAYTIGEHLFPSRDRRPLFPDDVASLVKLYPIATSKDMKVSDKCTCPCSVGGCTPFQIMFKPSTTMDRWSHGQYLRDPEYVNKTITNRLNRIRRELFPRGAFQYPEQYYELLRVLTFDKLRIRHTCCMWYATPDQFEPRDEDEIEEIQSEDSALIQELETLMEEFQRVKFSSEDEFWDFLDNTWPPRVEEVIADMDRLEESEEHKQALRSIGVELQVVPEKRKWNRKLDLLAGVDWWLKRVDRIVAEAY
ncbi:hypothetical protein B0T19DRAFT_416113 [Cercophora scortea]|uniref:Fungal N-terminal domain-containing protein n=1 Tax=Cercophora scortea TaxID=314031 RepID=A0AAE0IWN3_9PEZI|nr:hypothetical protein B0T19DRAFT_416113 [Cercophora scortea]